VTHDPLPVQAVVFPTDPAAPVAAQGIDGSAAGVELLIDGQTEAVMLGDAGPVMFVDAYGQSKGLPANPRADPVRGPLPPWLCERGNDPRRGRRHRSRP